MQQFVSTASEQQQRRFMNQLNRMHLNDMQRLFNDLSSRCFERCVNSFRETKLTRSEDNCVGKCVDKFWKVYQRAGVRFSEQGGNMPGGAAPGPSPGS